MFSPAKLLHLRSHVIIRCASSASQTHYDVLELLPNATPLEIKTQFKVLSKKYHPDLNLHLLEEEKEANNTKYVEMVQAYDALKNSQKKEEYDALLGNQRGTLRSGRPGPTDWENQYYGESKYFSRSGGAAALASYSSTRYNNQRHRVKNFYTGPEGNTTFSGHHRNYGDRNDVPHFDYNEHLHKHLQFEQRILNRNLSESEREAILRQLAPDGDLSKVSEELITKHLMRRAQKSNVRAEQVKPSGTANPYMYQGPQNGGVQEASGGLGMATAIAIGAGLVYLLYHAFV